MEKATMNSTFLISLKVWWSMLWRMGLSLLSFYLVIIIPLYLIYYWIVAHPETFGLLSNYFLGVFQYFNVITDISMHTDFYLKGVDNYNWFIISDFFSDNTIIIKYYMVLQRYFVENILDWPEPYKINAFIIGVDMVFSLIKFCIYTYLFRFVLNALPNITYKGFAIKLMKNQVEVESYSNADTFCVLFSLFWRDRVWGIILLPLSVFFVFSFLLLLSPLASLVMFAPDLSVWISTFLATWWMLSRKRTGRWIQLDPLAPTPEQVS